MATALAFKYSYDSAEAAARRLEREELIERDTYEVDPSYRYPPCEYCEEEQGDAVLAWHWYRSDATTDGHAGCCCSWSCCRAVLSEAELDADPENIRVEHPVTVVPVPPAIAA